VELLVTIIVLAVIGTLLATSMLGQQRFFQRAYEMVGVRRELRTAMSMVPTDLRGLSSIGGDVLSFTSEEMTFRATVGASIVCGRDGLFTLHLPPLELAHNTLTSWAEAPPPGDRLYAFTVDGRNTNPPGREQCAAIAGRHTFAIAHAPAHPPQFQGQSERGVINGVNPDPAATGGLRINGTMDWFGLIVVRDDIDAGNGTARVYGSVMARNAMVDNELSSISGTADFFWSRCAVESALRGSAILTRTRERSWVQLQ
jgi:type II secretory pathway pseudopilin PulG